MSVLMCVHETGYEPVSDDGTGVEAAFGTGHGGS